MPTFLEPFKLRCSSVQTMFGWTPVVTLLVLLVWGLYAYIRHVCIDPPENSVAKQVLYIAVFLVLWILVTTSIVKAVANGPIKPPHQYYLTGEEVSIVHQLDPESARESTQQEAIHLLRTKADNLCIETRGLTQCGIRYCHICCCLKPDRAHHCSTCNQCVLKMDHHCAWLNNCISYSNYKYFLLVLIYGILFNTFCWTTSIEFVKLYFFKKSEDSNVPVEARVSVAIIVIVCAALSFSSLVLFCYHVFLVTLNRTTLENYRAPVMKDGCIQKRAFDLGLKQNIQQVFGTSPLRAILPIKSTPMSEDGVHFALKYLPPVLMENA